MTEQEARAALEAMVAHDQEPALTSAEVDRLLAGARRADAAGLGPHEDGWTPTYDLNSAAAQGWRIKAGKVAGRYAISTDGQTMSRNQVIEHCLAMAAEYRKRVQQALFTGVSEDELLNREVLL